MGCCSSTDSQGCCSAGSSDDCCSSNDEMEHSTINHQAEQLAALIIESPEYQAFVRHANEVNSLPEIQQILLKIQKLNRPYADPQETELIKLHEQLESHPAVISYRSAEAAVKNLLQVVDDAISATAGVPFAVNAVRSSCG